MKATASNVIILPAADEQKSTSGIVLDAPGSSPKMSYQGTIIDAGPECKNTYAVGDRVVYNVSQGLGEQVNGVQYLFVPEEAIKAIL